MTTGRGFVIALLGAESTGKTTLAHELRDALGAETGSVLVVPEYLREFCEHHRRTPRRDEQARIAAAQTRRIAAAAQSHALVIADTSALMIAVYSDLVFGDTALYPQAEAAQAHCDLTLLTSLDLPWQADGLQRDGPHVRAPVDAKLRAALGRAGTSYSVVCGFGPARLEAALACVRQARAAPAGATGDGRGDAARWRWHCERCGDADCERHPRLAPR